MATSLSDLEREFSALVISDVKETGKELGRGAYGEVREAEWFGAPCATKRVHAALLPEVGAVRNSKVANDFVRECRTWKNLRHPNIVQLLGVLFKTDSPLPVLVMERMSTSLRLYIEAHTKVEVCLPRKADILLQVARGLSYLHSHKHVHRDLSPNNILLDTEGWRAKITDFGVSRALGTAGSRTTGTYAPGTPAFMPPEMFEIPARFSDKMDVFSLGCVVIFTITHQWPEPGPPKKTVGGKLVALSEHKRRELYLVLYSERERVLYLQLTVRCLQEDPSNRPSSAALAEDMFRIVEEMRKGSARETAVVAMAMAKSPPLLPPVTVAVIGIPSSQNDGIGSGKSCICDRFLHPGADEYTGEHSVLVTQQDYSSSVVNSTNFLYWGYQDLNMGGADEEGGASGGGGTPCRLHLIEHTEFIDLDTGQPFHSAQPYMKRVCNTKVLSKGKVAYISFKQLTLPESFPDAPKLPDKLAVDAFLLCVDASADFSDGSIQRQFLNRLLPELIKTKKPYVLAITKCDIASPEAIKVVSEFASKQKKQPPVVEVSALHGGINVSTAVLLAAHHGNQKFGIPKPKNPTFADEKKVRDELVATAKEKLTTLIKNVATEFDMKPPKVFDLIIITPEGKEYVRLQGTKAIKTVIRLHLSSLRNAKEIERQEELMKKLHDVLKHCVPKLEPLPEGESQDLEDDKKRMLELVTSHEKYKSFFLDDVGVQKKSQSSLPSSSSSLRGFSKLWCCDAVLKKEEERVPWSFLMMKETEKLLLDYTMEAKQRALDEKLLMRIDKALQSCQDDILPGTSMEEAFQLAGCSSEGEQVQDRLDLQRLYDAFNRNLEVKHGKLLQELFLEFPELFMLEEGTKEVDALKASHEKIKEIHEVLKDNERYQLFDGRANFRQSTLLKHSAVFFTKKGTLMEDPVQPVLDEAAFRVHHISPSPNGEHIHSLSWILDPKDAYLDLALVGQNDNIGKLRQDIKSQCSSTGRLEIGNRFCYPNMELFEYCNCEDIVTRIIPQAAIFVIDSHHSLKWLDGVVQRMCALSDDHQLQSLVGMPLVILALGEEFMNENSAEVQHVTEVSNRLQCGLLCEHRSATPARLLHPPAAAQLLKLLVLCVDRTTQILQPVFTPGLANLSISLCALPGDPYNMADMLGVWLHQPLSWYHEEHHQQVLQVFLWERATFVHIALKSHSLINTSKICPTDSSSPIHGYVLVYCTARKASFANAKYLIQKVLYSIPTLLVGIPPSATDKGQLELISEGRMLAEEKENVHFIFADGENWKSGCLNPFYLLCYNRRLSSVQTQNAMKKKLSTITQTSIQRHSMHLGATLPLPCSVALLQEGATAGIQLTTDSDKEEMELPSRDCHTVPPFRRHPPKPPTQTSPVSGKQDQEVMYAIPDKQQKPKSIPPPILHEKPKVGALQNSPSSPSTQHVAKVLTKAESSLSPKAKKKGGFWRRNAMSKGETPTTSESTPPNPISLAQEVVKKAKTLPRSGRDSAEPPELPICGYLSDEAEDDAPELPPREYHWSDVESDSDDDEDDDAGGNEEILQKVYECLAKFGGPSKETEKLYDMLEQYQKILIARKQTTQQLGGATGYGEYDEAVHTNTSEPSKQSEACLYGTCTVEEIVRTVPPSCPTPPPPAQTTEEAIVSNLGDKELKQRLKLMKRAAKEIERQQRLEKKKEKRDEELRKKEEKLKKKAMKSPLKQKGQKDKAAPQKKSYFGSELTDITTEDNRLPVFVVRCVEVIDKDGLDVDRIYRLSGKQDEVVELHCKFDNDHNLDIAALDYDVTTISSALKAFFKLLPTPLFPDDITQGVLTVFASEDGSRRDQRLTQVLLKMPKVNLKILAYLCQHLHRISLQSAVNRMSSSSLAIVFWPTLMRPPIMDLANPSQQLKWQKVMTTLIDKPDIVPDPDLEGAD